MTGGRVLLLNSKSRKRAYYGKTNEKCNGLVLRLEFKKRGDYEKWRMQVCDKIESYVRNLLHKVKKGIQLWFDVNTPVLPFEVTE